ncbi:MAG: IS1634 family transposase, partial [Candidatus Methanomethylophilaceae archaeon]|nr:IS1634 family transposase [Candidatus Methanomethylophilaceae archaeon]
MFVSDLDAPPEMIYAAHEERWEMEVLFRFYKCILDPDETRVESDQSVIGTEFVNFLSMIMMCRL